MATEKLKHILICPNCRWGLSGDQGVCPRCGVDVRTPPEPPPRRAEPRWWWRFLTGWRLATAIAVLVLVGGLLGLLVVRLTTSHPPSPPIDPVAGVAPARAGSAYVCPPGAPIRAFRADRHYYWPNHPIQPAPDVRPSRCYAMGFEARDAGYTEGPLPAGSKRVSGVYLVPVDLRDDCARAARTLGFAVPCPTLLPNPPAGRATPGCADPPPFADTDPPCVIPGGAFLLAEMGFAIPPAYAQAGLDRAEGDIFVAAVGPGGWATGAGEAVTSCPEAVDKGTTPITFDAGTKGFGQRIHCPVTASTPLAGYLMVRWTVGDVVYQAGIAGDAGQHRRVVDEIIASVRLVPPR